MGRTAGLPCHQLSAPASPLDTSGVLEAHNPEPGILVPAADQWGDPAAAADRTGCWRCKAALASLTLDPWDQAAVGAETSERQQMKKQKRRV